MRCQHCGQPMETLGHTWIESEAGNRIVVWRCPNCDCYTVRGTGGVKMPGAVMTAPPGTHCASCDGHACEDVG